MPQNPVINKFGQAARANPPDLSTNDLNAMFAKPAYSGPRTARYMTLDDVVQRTGAMLLVVLAAGAASWELVTNRAAGAVIIVSVLAGFGLAMYMSLTLKANAVTSLLYAALEGTALGAISRIFNDRWPGIVVQAITGTVAVAGGMLFVYKIGAIRVTPKFTRVVFGATLGVVGLMLVNGLAYLFHPGGLGLRSGGAMAVIFSLICIVVASMNLVVDFDMVERGIRNGADQKFAWFAAFGLTVTLVWLYLEILRLLSYLRE
ncbi:MAG: hypothetical protein QOG80_1798 [Pseudonocardiales bacterium]|jgi:uncharacterized YccA/Bax inhibitor family protein|nr:hypothetical protein [Pseudonocardiales bacterium]